MDDVKCPLDLEFAEQISALLAPPSPQSIKDYYGDVVKSRRYCGVEVKESGEFGKGAYATKDFKEEELILKDQMLVAAQHSYNKIDCLVCSYCFCFIGSIELQIGRKLFLHNLKLPAEVDDDNKTFSDTSDEGCPSELMDSEVRSTKCCKNMQSSSSGDVNLNSGHISEGVLASLMNGTLTLPYTKDFSLPPIISCLGGCEEEHYCSEQCAKADWAKFHSLLCTGEKSQSPKKEALVKFLKHANRTNDIFILAAKVISYTILKYKRLKNAYFEEKEESNGFCGKDKFPFSLILEAWKPTSMGFKKRWWDCIALPDDVDDSNEGSFRMQIKKLAFTSLQLLKEAIFDIECAPLFSLEIYGHIIGMFELNNLDLVVASPVEDYFVYIDDLPLPEKEEAEKITRPFLDALGDDYSNCCGGSAFFPIQSCMNHSCCPNAKAFKRDEDRDGETVILAVRPIRKGEEITISYIEDGLPYKERQKQLADYGFKCRCSKCLDEEQNHSF